MPALTFGLDRSCARVLGALIVNHAHTAEGHLFASDFMKHIRIRSPTRHVMNAADTDAKMGTATSVTIMSSATAAESYQQGRPSDE